MPNSDDKFRDSAVRLGALREEIDAVDAALHDLVMRRTELAGQMGSLKAQGGLPGLAHGNPIRPAREAAILRKLAARHRGAPPFTVIAQIWRELIAGNLRRQCAFGLAVLDTGDGRLMEIAHAGFGSLTPATAYPRPADVIDAVAAAPEKLAILPAPAGAAPEWLIWPELLAQDGAPRILSALPVLGGEGCPEAFAAGFAPAEPSGDDLGFVLLTGRSRPGPGEGELAEAGFEGRIEAAWPSFLSPGLYCRFALVRGFVTPQDAALLRLDDLRRRDGGGAMLIGTAPAPIRPPDGPGEKRGMPP